ncbi:Msx2-interacting protein [Fasciola gigantica]|uniref:Msx2-interacting protein n=1 Tax=Fasciola gigantica TaxID=46835 RepID=A0A504Z980_FASGI|nr:Msx2-interacting protein [Fasciola gigantica]
MRATRYLWISNLPVRTSEQDIRDVLQSHGKIQSIRIHSGETTCSAVVAFVDTKSATRAIESTVRLNKIKLALQYCESSGVPASSTQESAPIADDPSLASSSVMQNDAQLASDNRSVSGLSDSGSSTQERRKKLKLRLAPLFPSYNCSSYHHSESPRPNFNGSGMSGISTSSTGQFEGDHRGLQIRHLPLRSSDTNLREGLFHEYKKHGKITSVVIRGQGEDRYGIVTFKRSEDAERAFEVSRGKVFFGTPISVSLHEGIDSEDPDLCPPEHALDEYHPKATKTLFVGNLCSSTITQDELRRTFMMYGEIIEIDIKIQANQPGTSYAFVQFSDIKSVVRALSKQETIRVGSKPVKLGFGKSQPTNVVWLDNLAPTVNESFLARQFGRYGHLTHVLLDRKSRRALLYFDTVEMAQRALNETRNRTLIGRKVQLDYAGYECQVAFVRRLAKYDGFSQVYDNYRERIQELLALWPSYGNVLPLLDRQRQFGDIEKDIPHVSGDSCGHSISRRSASRRVSRSEHNLSDYSGSRSRGDQSGSSRQRPQSTKDLLGSGYTRHRTSGKETILENSPSPSSDACVHTKSRRLHGRSSHHKMPTASPPDEHGSPKRTISQVPDATWRPNRHPSATSKALRPTTSSRVSTHQPSHYLNETDDVSSDSLSPDLEPEGSISDSPVIRSSHSKGQRLSTGSVSREIPTARRQTPSCIESTSHDSNYTHPHKSHGRCYRDSISPVTSKKLRSADGSRVSCQIHVQPNSTTIRTPVSPHSTLSREFVDRTVSRSPSGESFLERRMKRSLRVSAASYETKIERSSRSRELHTRCSYHSEEVSLHSQSVDLRPESHDTLTKLELERAKLLRELSMLNSEVGSHKSKPISAKKRLPPDASEQLCTPKIRRLDTENPTNAGETLTACTTEMPVTVCSSNERICSGIIDDPSGNQVTRPPSRLSGSRPSNGCRSSSSEPGDLLSPVVTGHTTCVTIPDVYSAIEISSETHPTESRTQLCGASSCMNLSRRPNLITSSPRLMMPPEPTSPLTRLSPESPVVPDESSSARVRNIPPASGQILSPDSTLSSSRKIASSPSKLSGIASIRDPRLVAHHSLTAADIPPPPPPPPDCLKLPLWVDTSQLSVHSIDRFSQPPPNTSFPVNNKTESQGHCLLESENETNSSQEVGNCSLDERIRLLDAQLLKSEKARPAVDYSKFRIRRKVEPSASSMATDRLNPTTPAQSSPAVLTSLGSLLPVSPIIDLSCVYPPRLDRGLVPECVPATPKLTTASTARYASPGLPCPTSPISIPRLADTSEFVKSMLSSSKPSPSNSSEHLAVPAESVSSRSVIRYPVSASSTPISITLDANVKTSSITSVSSATNNFIPRQFGPVNPRLLPQTCGSVHSSLSGTQPIGVATRLPSVTTPYTDLSIRPSNGTVYADGSHVKSILKRDVASTTCDSLIKSSAAKQSPPDVSPTNVPSTTPVMASCDSSVGLMNKKLSTDTLVLKSEKSVEQPLKITTSGTNRQATSLKSTRPVSTEGKKAGTTQTAIKLKNSKNDSNCVLTGPSKPPKLDPPRHSLDDSVFKTSMEKTGNKIDRKRCRTDSLQGKTRSNSLPGKGDEPSQASKSDVMKTSSDVRDLVLSSRKTVSKRTVDSVSNGKLIDRTPLFEKHKTSFLQVTKAEDSATKDVKTSRIQMKARPADGSVRSSGSVPSKKKREARKRIIEGDASNEDEAVGKTAGRSGNDTELSGYESMYDKIKRRANKGSPNKKPAEKTGVLQRLLKARGKTVKQATKQKHRAFVSSVDSDTDECLSDSSSEEDKSGMKERQRTKVGVRQSKSSKETDRFLKQRSNSKCKNANLWSGISCIKKNRDSDETCDGKSKIKVSRTPLDKSDLGRQTQQLSTVRDSEQTRPRNVLPAKPNTKFDYGDSDASILKNKIRQSSVESSLLGPPQKSKNTLKSYRRKVKLSTKSTGGHRSLVHRMFASTDSETPSLSSSETDSEDDRKQPLSSAIQQHDSSTRMSTPRVSRSCSPDDIGADDAIRHTFGAFTRPDAFTGSKSSPTVASNASNRLSSPESSPTKNQSETNCMVSKSTPPTLPMLDSSSSAEQLAESQLKGHSRVSGDWNIFTSLASNTLPAIDPYPRASTPTTTEASSEGIFNGRPKFEMEKSGSDLDELPSLEKHDDDDSSKLDAGSLLLNDSGSLLNPPITSNNVVDDDLPPPVVSAVDEFSPSVAGDTDHVAKNRISDVIEEIVYDGLEVPVVTCDTVGGAPSKSDFCAADINVKLEPNVSSSTEKRHIVLSPDTTTTSKVVSSAAEPTTDSDLSQGKPQALSVSSAPLTLPPTVFAPIAMLAPGSHSDDLPAVGQPLLVTVPGSTTGVTFASSGLALLPASLSANPAPPNKPSQVARHVALILPATPLSMSSSLSQTPGTASILSTATLVYSTTSSQSPNGAPPSTSSRTSSATSSLSVCTGRGSPVPPGKTVISSVVKPTVLTDTPLCGSFEPLPTNELSDSCPSEEVVQSSIHNLPQDPPDYTSYVQRVIERVKQEKDEEISHQREKIRRPKKVSNSVVSIPCLSSNTGASYVFTLTSSVTPQVTSLPPIAPMPTPVTGSKITLAAKPSVPANVDSQAQSTASRKFSDAKHFVTSDLKERTCRGTDDDIFENMAGHNEDASALMPIMKTVCSDVLYEKSESAVATKCEPGSKSSIDDIIDAVLGGQFDENEYVEKILKGTFDQSSCHRSDFCSPSNSVADPNSPLRTPDESNKFEVNITGSDKSSGSTTAASTIPSPTRAIDTLAGSSPSRLFTPMHVLTLVAANAAAPQKMSSVSAVSPNPQAINPPSLTVPPTFTQRLKMVEPQSPTAMVSPATFPGANLPNSASLPVSGMEQLAAQLSSNPLTSYFYSLLARQPLNSATPPVSADSNSCKPQETSHPPTLQNSLKNLNIPSTGDGADYLAAAAAAMAAMAAMTSTSGTRTVAPLDHPVYANGLMTSCSSESHMISDSCTDFSLLREYPVSWRGRLSLKNEEVHVQMHYLSGNEDLLKACLGVIAEQQALANNTVHTGFDVGLDASITQPLKIVQRMRLEPSQLEGVQRKLRQTGDFCMCLTLATSPPGIPEGSVPSERARMNQVLCDGFIKYMVDKCAAGIINVCHPTTQQNLFVIHIFPPCEFSRNQLDGCAPNLMRQLTQYSTPHLLVVVTTV